MKILYYIRSGIFSPLNWCKNKRSYENYAFKTDHKTVMMTTSIELPVSPRMRVI